MKNSKIIAVVTTFLVCCFSPSTLISQTISQRFDQFECAKPTPKKFLSDRYNFDYVLYENNVVRRIGNHIDYLDENLEIIDHLSLPEKENLKNEFYSYQVAIGETYIFVCQTLKADGNNNVIKLLETKLYRIRKQSFLEIETLDLLHTKDEDQISIFEQSDKLFISTKSEGIIKKFYTVDNKDFTLSTYPYDNLLHKLKTAELTFTEVTKSKDTLRFVANKFVKMESTTTTIGVDKNLEILTYRKIVKDHRKDQMTVYDIQNTQIFQGSTDAYNATFLSGQEDFFDISIDSSTFYFRQLRSQNQSYDSWVSTNFNDKKIKIEDKFKDVIANRDISSWSICYPIPDPANESITIRMTFPYFAQSINPYGKDFYYQQYELCVYINLTKDLELRSIYSATITYNPMSLMIFSLMDQGGYGNSTVLREFNIIREYENNSTAIKSGNKNAYDVLYDLKTGETDICTIFHSFDKQYLFVEKEDGTSYGYVFAKK